MVVLKTQYELKATQTEVGKIISIVGRFENVCAISMSNNKLEMQTFMLPKNTQNGVTENRKG